MLTAEARQGSGLGAADDKGGFTAGQRRNAPAEVAEAEPVVTLRVLTQQTEAAKDAPPGIQGGQSSDLRWWPRGEIELKLNDALGRFRHAGITPGSRPQQCCWSGF